MKGTMPTYEKKLSKSTNIHVKIGIHGIDNAFDI